MDLSTLLSDLLPPLFVQLVRLGGDLYLDHRRSQSRSSGEEPRGKHEKRS